MDHHAQQSSQHPWVTGLWLGLAELFEEHHRHRAIKVDQSSRKIDIGVNKTDCYIADIKQYKYDDISNKMMGVVGTLSELWTESWMVQMVRTKRLRMSTTESLRQRRQSSRSVSFNS